MEVEQIPILVGPLGWVFDVPSCMVGCESRSAERAMGGAVRGKVRCNCSPSIVETGSVNGHSCSWVERRVGGLQKSVPTLNGVSNHRCCGGDAFDLELADVQFEC